MRLALDEDDYLYIADKHGNVKIVQYLEQEYSIVTFGQREKKLNTNKFSFSKYHWSNVYLFL